MAEYDDDYNGEDLDIGGVEIDRGWLIVAFPFNFLNKNSDSGVFTIRGSLRGAHSARLSQVNSVLEVVSEIQPYNLICLVIPLV